MAFDGSLKFDTSIDGGGFSSGLGKIGGIAKGGLSVVAGAITAVTAAMGAGVALGVKYNSSIETYQTSFEVMTGSATKAKEIIENLKKVGAETPFELKDLADTTQLLMNYGQTADEAQSKMMMLGDISQGSAEKMQRIATAYGQMSSAGKVQLEDIKQMIEAGYNPLQEISQTTGESMSSLYDRISKGTVSIDEITASMQRSTAEGGKYFQSMEKQSQTFSGLISTLKDNALQLVGSVVEPISASLVGSLLPSAVDAMTGLTNAFQTGGVAGLITAGTQMVVSLVQGIAEGAPTLINSAVDVINGFIIGITEASPNLLTSGFTILESLANGIISIIGNLAPLALTILTSLTQYLIENAPSMADGISSLLNNIVQYIKDALPVILDAGLALIMTLADGITQALPNLVPVVVGMVLDFVSWIADNLPQIIQAGLDMLLALGQGIADSIPQIVEKAPEIIGKLVGGIQKMLPQMLEIGIEIIVALVTALIGAIPKILQVPGKIFSTLKGAMSDIDWGSIGHNIITGIVNGVKSAGGMIKDAVVSAAKSAFDAAKDFLGIHSPSRLFRDEIGVMMSRGMAVGFEKESPLTDKAIAQASSGSIGLLQTAINGISLGGISPTNNILATVDTTSAKAVNQVKSAESIIDYEKLGYYVTQAFIDADVNIKVNERAFGTVIKGVNV